MSTTVGEPVVKAPVTYQDWLACFDIMKSGTAADSDVFDAACMGSFVGSDLTKSALQKQLVETVNAILDRSVKRFLRSLNENLSFHELVQTELLFKRLKKDIDRSLFFTRLTFLPKEFRSDLESSVKNQMGDFWAGTVRSLHELSLGSRDPELEDVLFLVKRIRLYQ